VRREFGGVVAEIAAWSLALMGGAMAVRSRAGVATRPYSVPAVAPIARLADTTIADSLSRAAAHIAASDPFRMTHSPSSVAYAPGVPATPGYQPPQPPPKPRLGLRGVFGERGRLRGILVGVPGRDAGAIVQRGDTLGGLHVLRVTSDSVIVAGFDTTWTLTVHAGWQP